MVVVDFSRFVFLFGVVFSILFLLCLFVLLALSSGQKKRSLMVKSYIFFMGLFLLGLFLAWKNPEWILGWIQ